MKLSTAVEGFFIARIAEGYAPGTLGTYHWALNLLISHLADPELETITHADLLGFFAYLRTGYHMELSGSSLENIWKAIRSFYNWAVPTLDVTRPDRDLPRPRYKPPVIVPFKPEEIQAMIKACDRTALASTTRRTPFTMPRPTAKRDRAIVLLLLDTGLRVSEAAHQRSSPVDRWRL